VGQETELIEHYVK